MCFCDESVEGNASPSTADQGGSVLYAGLTPCRGQGEFRACILLLDLLKPLGGRHLPPHFTVKHWTPRSEKHLAQTEEGEDNGSQLWVRPSRTCRALTPTAP